MEEVMEELPEMKYLCEEPGCGKEAIECRVTIYRFDVFDRRRFSLGYVWYLLRSEGLRWMWGLLRDGFADAHDYYCSEHAGEYGYCWSCGEFSAGTEGFDFRRPRGLCDNCRDEFEHDFDDGDEDDWFYMEACDGDDEHDTWDDIAVYEPDPEEEE